MARFDPARLDFSPYGFSSCGGRRRRWAWGDRHNEIQLNLLEGGRLVYLMGGRKVTVPAGRMIVFWAGVSHQIVDFQSLTEYFVLTIPQDGSSSGACRTTSHNRSCTASTIVEPDEGRLASDRYGSHSGAKTWGMARRTPPRQPAGGRNPLAAAGVERGRAATTRRNSPPVLDQRHSSRAERMACFIAQNYTQPLTAETIGQHVGLHPNYGFPVPADFRHHADEVRDSATAVTRPNGRP